MVKGLFLLLMVISLFSWFSFKAPKGDKAMTGLANAAVATFLVEAILRYIAGDMIGLEFLKSVGMASGSMGGVAAVVLVSINMGLNPVYAVVSGVATFGFGIIPGFIAGYFIYFIGTFLEKKLPAGLDVIVGAIVIASLARLIAQTTNPLVTMILDSIGETITLSAMQSPLLMGFLLGGIIKVICTSPLSSMALTAMLGLNGLAMGIASIACVGGAFTNGIIFKKLGLGDNSKVMAVMLEPLTQADVVTKNAVPIYTSNFLGGGLSGIAASIFMIVNDAPGTASPIPGLIAPFAFNEPYKVVLAITLAVIGGTLAGYLGSWFFSRKVSLRKPRQTSFEV
jgi:fructose-specific phosphotransferase system IIC component